jgi:DNA invertase Pin-like site-specific DNA recombinase
MQINQSPKPTEMVIYARTPTDNVRDMAKQIVECVHLADSKGYQVIDIVTDIGSGLNMNRIGINRVLNYIRSNRVDAICTYSLDRISRRLTDAKRFERMMGRTAVKFETVTSENMSALPSSYLENDFAGLMSNYESKMISLRVRRAMQARKEAGLNK